jgi:excinuclease ABC subunit C
VLLPIAVEDSELIEQVLTERRGRPVRLMVPERGEKKQLVQRAVANALESLRQARARWLADTGKKREALEQLQDALSLPELPARIECYDISNIQGTSAVGSMVVFVDGHPRAKEYRKFRIKGVKGQNDFAMMQEVLKRRFWKVRRETEGEGANEGTPERPEHEDTDRGLVNEALRGPNAGAVMTAPSGNGWTEKRKSKIENREGSEIENRDGREYDESFGTMPDLVIVDGGKGQVSAAHDAMRNLGVGQIPLAGLAKRFEELYVKDVSEPIVLDRTSQALYLVQRIRDEAHRFAITYHRGVRSKAGIQSALDSIQGIGPKRKKALLRKFGSVKGIREAGVEEVAATPGFTRALAEKVLSGL